jgi:hypothetical protein
MAELLHYLTDRQLRVAVAQAVWAAMQRPDMAVTAEQV